MKATAEKPSFLSQFQYYIRFVPINWNLVVLGIAVFLGYWFITENYRKPDSTFELYLKLFGWIVLVFAGLVFSVGIFSALFCWIYYLVNRNKKAGLLKVNIDQNVKRAGYVGVSFDLPNILIPFLGFAKARLIFEDKQQSEEISLRANSWIHWFGAKKAEKKIYLPHRQIYEIDSVLLTFRDIFQLFSLPLLVQKKSSFFVQPKNQEDEEMEIPPSKSEEMTQRIKKLKRVDGDLLNYKNFESGDDVRRIVWKIYAKNRELVVRMPETINPFASHIYFHGSFYKEFATPSDTYSRLLLDAYKDGMYHLYKLMEKGDMKVSFHSDQPLSDSIQSDQGDSVMRSIVHANWQTTLSPQKMTLNNPNMVLCVSSLVNAEEVADLLERKSLNIVYVKCSEVLESTSLFRFKDLFLKSDQSFGEKMKLATWKFSSHRRKIRKNEKALEELLNVEIQELIKN
jgi:hypothetical protein